MVIASLKNEVISNKFFTFNSSKVLAFILKMVIASLKNEVISNKFFTFNSSKVLAFILRIERKIFFYSFSYSFTNDSCEG